MRAARADNYLDCGGASPESLAPRRPDWRRRIGRSRIGGLGITGRLHRHLAIELRERVGRDRLLDLGILQAGERPALDDFLHRRFVEAEFRQLLGRGRVEIDRIGRRGLLRRLLRGVSRGVLGSTFRGLFRRFLGGPLGDGLSRRGGRRDRRETGQNQRRQPSTGSHGSPRWKGGTHSSADSSWGGVVLAAGAPSAEISLAAERNS